MSTVDPAIASAARAEVRRWLAADRDAVRTHIVRLGHEEVASAAGAIARLDAAAGDGCAADAVEEVRRLVEEVHAPAQRRRLGIAIAPAPLERRLSEAAPLIAAALDRLAGDGERLARHVADARAIDRRLADAAAALDALTARLDALARGTDAATRELRHDEARSAFLRDELLPLLAERLVDVHTQQLVLDQGRLSLKLLIAGNDALLAAIDRARHQTVPALRTAVAAARALDRARAAQAGAAALETGVARDAIAAGVRAVRDALGGPNT